MMATMTDHAHGAVAPARACAHRVLRRVFEDGAYAEKALLAEAGELDARDRALAMRLAYGAVQRAGTSDHLIETLAGRPVERLDPQLRASLRLGLYELLYLHGAPDYAVVADAVELAKAPGRADTDSSTPCCAGPPAKAPRGCCASSASSRRPKRPSSTPTRDGSPSCGGRRSARTRRAR